MAQFKNPKNHPISAQTAQADAMFNSIGDGAIATDEFGRITKVNPVAQRLLQFTEAELVGEWFPKIIVAMNEDGQPLNLIERPITRAFLTGKNISQKILYKTRDGDNLPVAVSVSPILLDGKPIGAIEVFHDVTLENEVDRMKSEFISLASHQLRTPLSAIKTYSHMLLDGYMGDLNPAQRKSLRTIITASNRMNELISTLLNITRIESGTIAVTPKNLRVYKITEEVIRELALTASEKGVTLNLGQIGKLTSTAKTDTLILKEIVSNIVSNAIKYTPAGGSVSVAVEGRRKDVLVSVRDTGWGIPEFAQDQIFSKFFRANNIIQRETTGTGLGLYLVRGLLDRLEGNIWFDSVEGVGTTFYFTVPRQLKTVTEIAPLTAMAKP